MEKEELKSLYDKLLKDEDFDKLDLGLKNPNIFQILRITKNEIRHSNFLSWLLDPYESHKLGDIFLKRFLREVFSSDKFLEIDQGSDFEYEETFYPNGVRYENLSRPSSSSIFVTQCNEEDKESHLMIIYLETEELADARTEFYESGL